MAQDLLPPSSRGRTADARSAAGISGGELPIELITAPQAGQAIGWYSYATARVRV